MSETVVDKIPETETEAPVSLLARLTTDPEITIFITYIGLIILAIIPIYIGSMKSIKQPKVKKSVIIKFYFILFFFLCLFMLWN